MSAPRLKSTVTSLPSPGSVDDPAACDTATVLLSATPVAATTTEPSSLTDVSVLAAEAVTVTVASPVPLVLSSVKPEPERVAVQAAVVLISKVLVAPAALPSERLSGDTSSVAVVPP